MQNQSKRKIITFGTQVKIALVMRFYYIDADEIQGYFLFQKIMSSSCAVKILILSFRCEDIGVILVTKITISQ